MNKSIAGRLLIVILLFLTLHSNASIRLPRIIGSNMVMQQKQLLPVWGWDNPGQAVTVVFGGSIKSTVADAAGYWKVIMPSMKASAQSSVMRIEGSETIELSNILIGEVWLCSGQSNMEYSMKNAYAKPARSADSLALELGANYPSIRLFLVQKVLSTPDVTTTGWNECKGESLEKFSAIGYFFGKRISSELGVPVGLISSSWGGSRIEPWTSPEAYKLLPAFSAETAETPLRISSVVPGKNYASMIKPLAPFAMRGFLWYQGESNCMIEDGIRYADKMQALVDGWRLDWQNKEMPFYSVQLAPYYYTKRKDALPHTEATLAEFWEAQQESLKIPNTGMITITDLVDNLNDIHPPYKWVVARRLALLALSNTYDKKVGQVSGPLFERMTVKKDKAILTFKSGEGMKSSDGKALNWFEVQNENGKYEAATAVIDGNKIIVSSPNVRLPVNVRFAWSETAQPNLVNKSGLPAVPFRTDGPSWTPFNIN